MPIFRRRIHVAKNIDEEEICESFSYETFNKIPIRKLLIANIARETTHKELKECLLQYGKILNCILKKQIGDQKSYAFVTYATVEAAERAIWDGRRRQIELNDQFLRVLPAAPWHQLLEFDKNCSKKDSLLSTQQIHAQNNYLENESTQQIHAQNNHLEDQKNVNSLNDDCLMIIFNYLSIIERVKIERVCKRWQIISKESWISCKKLDLNPLKWGMIPFDCIYAPYLIHIVNRCGSYLTSLDLSESRIKKRIGNMTLIELAKLCSNLKSINIGGINVKKSGLRALAKYCYRIEKLTISFFDCFYDYKEEVIIFFSKLKNLQSLEIINETSYPKDNILLGLRTKAITNLILTNFYSVDLVFGETIPRMSNLKLLKLKRMKYGQPTKSPLSSEVMSSTMLKKCEVFEMSVSSSHYDKSLAQKMVHLANCFCSLKKIQIDGINFINDKFLNTLSKNDQQLTCVYIRSCPLITNKGLESITSMLSLEHFIIDNLALVTDEIFTDIPNLKSLYCLDCKGIRDAGLIKLVTLSKNIQLINVSGCSFISNKFIYAAIKATSYRKNILNINVGRTSVDIKAITKTSPFLKVEEDLFDVSRDIIDKISNLYFKL